MKSMLASKTLWTNAIAIAAMFIQTHTGFVFPIEDQALVLAVVNLVLRFVTKQPISWSTPKEERSGLMAIILTLPLVGAVIISGCAGTQAVSIMDDHPALTELAVRAAVGRVLAEKPQWAQPAVGITDAALQSMSGDGEVTLGRAEAEISERIPWGEMTVEERELLSLVIRAVMEEAERYLSREGVSAPGDVAVRVRQVLSWIRQAAEARVAHG